MKIKNNYTNQSQEASTIVKVGGWILVPKYYFI